MPSQLPVPTVDELLDAYRTGVRGDRDETADMHDGSGYDFFGGLGALVFRRLALRDRDTFRAIYFDFATGDEFVKLATKRFPTITPPVAATAGAGFVTFVRPSAGGGGGSFLKGTRITVVPRGTGNALSYVIGEDTAVDGAALITPQIPIVANKTGLGVAIDTVTAKPVLIRVEDQLYDNTFAVTRLVCADGTEREKDGDARGRIRKSRFDARIGYAKAVTDACVNAGATEVALFASDFLATNPNTQIESIGKLDADGYGDVGLNRVFVGDSSFSSPASLIRACTMALDGAAICGIAVQALPMQLSLVTMGITVQLWKDPGRAMVNVLKKDAQAAVLNYFGQRQNPFYYRFPAIYGAILKATRDVQKITFTTELDIFGNPVQPVLATLFNSVPINRYYVTPDSVTVTITGP